MLPAPPLTPLPRRSEKSSIIGTALTIVEALASAAARGAAMGVGGGRGGAAAAPGTVRLGRYEGDIIMPTLCERSGHKRDDTRLRVASLITSLTYTLGRDPAFVPEGSSVDGAGVGAVLETYLLPPLSGGAARSARTQVALLDVLTGILSAAGSGSEGRATGRHRLVRKLAPAAARLLVSAPEVRDASLRFFSALYKALERSADSVYRLLVSAKVRCELPLFWDRLLFSRTRCPPILCPPHPPGRLGGTPGGALRRRVLSRPARARAAQRALCADRPQRAAAAASAPRRCVGEAPAARPYARRRPAARLFFLRRGRRQRRVPATFRPRPRGSA